MTSPALLAAAFQTPKVDLLWAAPFALLLLSIALMPLINHHWWERRYPIVALALGAIPAIYYLFFHPDPVNARHAWLHEMQQYISFILLLAALYVVSGGIHIHLGRRATPLHNVVLLLTGAILANVVGTTGAAMLLLRPYIQINRPHIRPYHIVFFIFLVANCGGCLTPIGDPPLFMGYLKGIPFFWTLEHLWPLWAVCCALLLIIFFVIDTLDARKRPRRQEPDDLSGMRLQGAHNFLLICMILLGVFQPSAFEVGLSLPLLWSRELLMLYALLISRFTTRREIYNANKFTYAPIKEVAIIFVAIFSTMVPAINWLAHNATAMPLHTPSDYYWTTGALSAVLDNAPTYVVFLETKLATLNADGALTLLTQNPDAIYLIAISAASVFFGAMTYIGNGPNFMVKSIAESAGIQMPTFFGYFLRYALPVMLPVVAIIWLIFLSPWCLMTP